MRIPILAALGEGGDETLIGSRMTLALDTSARQGSGTNAAPVVGGSMPGGRLRVSNRSPLLSMSSGPTLSQYLGFTATRVTLRPLSVMIEACDLTFKRLEFVFKILLFVLVIVCAWGRLDPTASVVLATSARNRVPGTTTPQQGAGVGTTPAPGEASPLGFSGCGLDASVFSGATGLTPPGVSSDDGWGNADLAPALSGADQLPRLKPIIDSSMIPLGEARRRLSKLAHLLQAEPEDGVLFCTLCGALVVIGESGPHAANGDCRCVCGTNLAAGGDHVTSADALVLARGRRWRRYEAGPGEAPSLVSLPFVVAAERFMSSIGGPLSITDISRPARTSDDPPWTPYCEAGAVVNYRRAVRVAIARTGTGETWRYWQCGASGPIADEFWAAHMEQGALTQTACPHTRFASGVASWIHGPSGPATAGGVLRPTECHFSSRCSRCAGYCQHGWLLESVIACGHPATRITPATTALMGFMERLVWAIDHAPTGLIYVTGSGTRYEALEAQRNTGLDSLLPQGQWVVIVPHGEGPAVTDVMMMAGLQVCATVEAPIGVPLRCYGSLRLFAMYAATRTEPVAIVNRFTTVDHAYSVATAVRMAKLRRGSIVCCNTYGVAYANMAATAFITPKMKMNQLSLASSMVSMGAIYGHDEVIMPYLGPLVVALDPWCPLSYSVRFRLGGSPYADVMVELVAVTAADVWCRSQPGVLIDHQLAATYQRLAAEATPGLIPVEGTLWIVCDAGDLTNARLHEALKQLKCTRWRWIPPRGLPPGPAAVAAGASPYARILEIRNGLEAPKVDYRLARLAISFWVGPAHSAGIYFMDSSRHPWIRGIGLQMLSEKWLAIWHSTALHTMIGSSWIVGALIVGGLPSLPPGPLGVAVASFVSQQSRKSTLMTFFWLLVGLIDQVSLTMRGLYSWQSMMAAIGRSVAEAAITPLFFGLVWVYGSYPKALAAFRLLKYVIQAFLWIITVDIKMSPVDEGKAGVYVEMKPISLREIHPTLPDIFYAWHPRLRVGSRCFEGRFTTAEWGVGKPFVMAWGPTYPWEKCYSWRVAECFNLPAEDARYPLVYGPLANCVTGLIPALASQAHALDPALLVVLAACRAELWGLTIGYAGLVTATVLMGEASQGVAGRLRAARDWRALLAASRLYPEGAGFLWRMASVTSPQNSTSTAGLLNTGVFQETLVAGGMQLSWQKWLLWPFRKAGVMTGNALERTQPHRYGPSVKDMRSTPLPSVATSARISGDRPGPFTDVAQRLAEYADQACGSPLSPHLVWVVRHASTLTVAAEAVAKGVLPFEQIIANVRLKFPAYWKGHCNTLGVPTFTNGGLTHTKNCTGLGATDRAGCHIRYRDSANLGRCNGCAGVAHQGIIHHWHTVMQDPHPVGGDHAGAMFAALIEMAFAIWSVPVGGIIHVTSDGGGWAKRNASRGPLSTKVVSADMHLIIIGSKDDDELAHKFWGPTSTSMVRVVRAPKTHWPRLYNVWRRVASLAAPRDITVIMTNARIEEGFLATVALGPMIKCPGRIVTACYQPITPAPGGFSVTFAAALGAASGGRYLRFISHAGHVYGTDDLGASYFWPTLTYDPSPWGVPRLGASIAERRCMTYFGDHLFAHKTAAARVTVISLPEYSVAKAHARIDVSFSWSSWITNAYAHLTTRNGSYLDSVFGGRPDSAPLESYRSLRVLPAVSLFASAVLEGGRCPNVTQDIKVVACSGQDALGAADVIAIYASGRPGTLWSVIVSLNYLVSPNHTSWKLAVVTPCNRWSIHAWMQAERVMKWSVIVSVTVSLALTQGFTSISYAARSTLNAGLPTITVRALALLLLIAWPALRPGMRTAMSSAAAHAGRVAAVGPNNALYLAYCLWLSPGSNGLLWFVATRTLVTSCCGLVVLCHAYYNGFVKVALGASDPVRPGVAYLIVRKSGVKWWRPWAHMELILPLTRQRLSWAARDKNWTNLLTWEYDPTLLATDYTLIGCADHAGVELALAGTNCFMLAMSRTSVELTYRGVWLILIGGAMTGLILQEMPFALSVAVVFTLGWRFPMMAKSPGLCVFLLLLIAGVFQAPGTGGKIDWAWWRLWAPFGNGLVPIERKFAPVTPQVNAYLLVACRKLVARCRRLAVNPFAWERVRLEEEVKAWRVYGNDGAQAVKNALAHVALQAPDLTSPAAVEAAQNVRDSLNTGLLGMEPGALEWHRKLAELSKGLTDNQGFSERPILEVSSSAEPSKRPNCLPEAWLKGSQMNRYSTRAARSELRTGPKLRGKQARVALPPEGAEAVELWAACAIIVKALPDIIQRRYTEMGEPEQAALIWLKLIRGVPGPELRSAAFAQTVAEFIQRENLQGLSAGEEWAAYVTGYQGEPWQNAGSAWRDRKALSVGNPKAAASPAATLGALVARHVATGHDFEISMEAALRVWAESTLPLEGEDAPLKEVLQGHADDASWYRQRSRKGLSNSYRLSGWCRRTIESMVLGRIVGTTLGSLAAVVQAMLGTADRFLLLVLGDVVDHSGPRGQVYRVWRWLLETLGVEPRGSSKTVWAPLFPRTRLALTPSEELALLIGSDPTTIDPPEGKDLDKSSVAATLSKLGKDRGLDLTDLILQPERAKYAPKAARLAQHEAEFIAGDMLPIINEDGAVTERAAKLIEQFSRKGVDGLWLADDARVASSVARYQLCPSETTARSRAMVMEAVDAMQDRWPELFRNWQITRPEALSSYIKMAYSPGWPFIGSYKSRAELWASGWGAAVAEAATGYLKAGVYPDPTWHAFAKMQVIDGAKVLGGKAVRTVVAQDLTTSFIDHALMLEASKRPLPPGHDHVLGFALNEAGLLPHFQAVADRRNRAGFDAIEHDSRLSPVLFEGVAELAVRGYSWANSAKIDSLVRKRYAAIQSGNIHILQTGETVRKNRGGGTGQSQTTKNNTDALSLAATASWAIVTGRPVKEFWASNTLRVAGDNGMIGWDDNDFDIQKWADVCKDVYGVELTIDMFNQGDAMEFLAKLAVPGSTFKDEYESRGLAVPRLAVVHDPRLLALRRTGMTARLASAPLDQHLRGRIQRSGGHAMLLAHNPKMYDTVAHDWIEDATLLMRVGPEEVPFLVQTDSKGFIMGAVLNPDWVAPTEHARQNAVWLTKAGRLLSYDDVFSNNLKLQPDSQQIKRHKKVLNLQATTPRMVLAAARLEQVAEAFRATLPTWFVRMAAEKTINPIVLAVATDDYRLERWTWVMLVELHPGEPVTWAAWEAVVRVSPFSGVMDGPGFRHWVETKGGYDTLLTDTPDELGGYVIILMLAYVLINKAARNCLRGTFFTLLVSGFMFYSLDMVRLYSTIAILYWVATGSSSSIISALIPRDPYWVPKRMAHMIASLVPDSICRCVPWRVLTSWLPGITTWIAEARMLWPGQRDMQTSLSRRGRPEWVEAAIDVLRDWGTDDEVKYVSAPTSGGKSTEFVAMLASQTPRQIWLVLPSRFARDTYVNPWHTGSMQILATGSSVALNVKLVIMTYGQLLAHEPLSRSKPTFIVMDEMHMGTPEQVEAERLTRETHRVFTSATARHDLYLKPGRTLNVNVKRGGVVTVKNYTGSVEALIQRALGECNQPGDRIMVQVVGTREASDLADGLTKGGYPAVAVTRLTRSAPPGVHLVGTAVISTGVNVRPPPRIGVTSGVELVNNRGRTSLQYTTPSTHTQQIGRYGRDGSAIVFAPPEAGSGPVAVPYPNWRLYTSSLRATANFNQAYNLTHEISQRHIDDDSRVGIGSDTTTIHEMGRYSHKEVKTLRAAYLFLSVAADRSTAMMHYATWSATAALMPGCEQLAAELNRLSRADMLPHRDAVALIAASPYAIEINGVWRHHNGLRLLDYAVFALPEAA